MGDDFDVKDDDLDVTDDLKMTDAAEDDDPSNRRRFTRKQVTVKVGMKTPHGFWAGFTENVSEGGLFVATQAPFVLGDEVIVHLSLAGHVGRLPVKCRVKWIRPDTGGGLLPGMGLEFMDLADDALEQLRTFIESDNLEILFWDDE